MWYLIVSIPDLGTLTYFDFCNRTFAFYKILKRNIRDPVKIYLCLLKIQVII